MFHTLLHGFPWYAWDGCECEILFGPGEYEAALGYRTRRAVMAQLTRDVPRSVVVDARGRRIESARACADRTPHAAACTQAVFVPLLEWMHAFGILVSEVPHQRHPMQVTLSDGGDVCVSKRLSAFLPTGVCLAFTVQILVSQTWSSVALQRAEVVEHAERLLCDESPPHAPVGLEVETVPR